MSERTWFGKTIDFVLKPFRAGVDLADRHPPARKIRKYVETIRVDVVDSRLVLVVPRADKTIRQFAEVEVPDIDKMTPKQKAEALEVWARGANWMREHCAGLRRSEIKPVLKIYKEAVKLQKAGAKSREKQVEARQEGVEAIQKDPTSGIHAIPPTLSHARGRATEKAEDMGGALPSPA